MLLSVHLCSVPKQNFFSWSEVEMIEIKQRMNEYPPAMYRLANVLENRLKYLYRLQKIIFNYFDFNSSYYIFSPVVIICLFKLIEKRKF